jgi:polysaccharide biosynthesis/export protein
VKLRILTIAPLLCVLATLALRAQTVPVSPARTDITIGAGDMLDVSVFDTPELSGKIRVSEQGNASLPLIGDLHLAGLSTNAAQDLIERKLIDGDFVKDPQVSVIISEYATQGITILGEVNKPGIYPALGGKTLFDLISMASGLTPTAGNVAKVTHRGQLDDPAVVALRDPNGAMTSSNVALASGDTVVIGRAGIVYVIGDVGKPGGFVIDSNHMTVLQALALAEGVKPTAALGKARIMRKTSQGVEEKPLALKKIMAAKAEDPEVHPGDIVFVPGSAAKSAMKRGAQSALGIVSGMAVYGRF